MIAYRVYAVVLASRILGGGARKGGMPLYMYVANRILTAFQNLRFGIKLIGISYWLRAFARDVLRASPLLESSDDIVFDNQMIAQAAVFDFRIGEISCPT